MRIDLNKVVYFEGDGNYTCAVTINKLRCMVCLNLCQMEKVLADQLGEISTMFARMGKRFIVNTSFVYQINISKQQLILSDYMSFAFQIGASKEALKKLQQIIVNK